MSRLKRYDRTLDSFPPPEGVKLNSVIYSAIFLLSIANTLMNRFLVSSNVASKI